MLRGPVAGRRADHDARLAEHRLEIGLPELEPDRLRRRQAALAGVRRGAAARGVAAAASGKQRDAEHE